VKRPAEDQAPQESFATEIGRKAQRRVRAQRKDPGGGVWFGLGTFGMVGWSIAIPTVLGVLIGAWLETRVPVGFSWRLTLLTVGLVVGCLNAWYWVSKERTSIHWDESDDDE